MVHMVKKMLVVGFALAIGLVGCSSGGVGSGGKEYEECYNREELQKKAMLSLNQDVALTELKETPLLKDLLVEDELRGHMFLCIVDKTMESLPVYIDKSWEAKKGDEFYIQPGTNVYDAVFPVVLEKLKATAKAHPMDWANFNHTVISHALCLKYKQNVTKGIDINVDVGIEDIDKRAAYMSYVKATFELMAIANVSLKLNKDIKAYSLQQALLPTIIPDNPTFPIFWYYTSIAPEYVENGLISLGIEDLLQSLDYTTLVEVDQILKDNQYFIYNEDAEEVY